MVRGTGGFPYPFGVERGRKYTFLYSYTPEKILPYTPMFLYPYTLKGVKERGYYPESFPGYYVYTPKGYYPEGILPLYPFGEKLVPLRGIGVPGEACTPIPRRGTG